MFRSLVNVLCIRINAVTETSALTYFPRSLFMTGVCTADQVKMINFNREENNISFPVIVSYRSYRKMVNGFGIKHRTHLFTKGDNETSNDGFRNHLGLIFFSFKVKKMSV